jgi:hypothetical protein
MNKVAIGVIATIVLTSIVLAGVFHGDIRIGTSPDTSGPESCGQGTAWSNATHECVATGGSGLPPESGEGPISALFKVGAKNLYTSTALTSTTSVDVFHQNDLDGRIETVAVAAAATAGKMTITEGDDLFFHVFSTAASGYYDRMYRVNDLKIGAPVELMTPIWADGNPGSWSLSYTAIGNVQFDNSATKYWLIPTFTIIERASTAEMGYSAIWSGATAVTATGASSTTLPGGGSQASKYTASGDSFKIKFQLSLTAVSIGIGQPVLTISSTLPRQFQALFFVLWFSQNNTQTLDSDGPFSNGYKKLPFASTTYNVYWKVIQPVTSDQVSTGSRDEEITLNTTPLSTSTVIAIKFWCTDLQNPFDVSGGAADAAPTAYGAISAYGLTSTIDANGFTSSSGVPASECDYTVITTHS